MRRRPPLTMWQLSFSGVSEEEGLALRGASPAQLLAEAGRRMAGWMNPVQDMVGAGRGGGGEREAGGGGRTEAGLSGTVACRGRAANGRMDGPRAGDDEGRGGEREAGGGGAPSQLLAEARRRMAGWIETVQEMLGA